MVFEPDKWQAFLLCAGVGNRLKPYTDDLPKPLMPIGNFPILEYWLSKLNLIGINKVLVNVHHHRDQLVSFLKRDCFIDWLSFSIEEKLLGTAGAIRENVSFFDPNKSTLLIHADNWSDCDLKSFLEFHKEKRSQYSPMTMMVFKTEKPKDCGIVKICNQGIVQHFEEKSDKPSSTLANAAVYGLEHEVIKWIAGKSNVIDFSTQVIPNYTGRISTWLNEHTHIDIGSVEGLKKARCQKQQLTRWHKLNDRWRQKYKLHSIHSKLNALP